MSQRLLRARKQLVQSGLTLSVPPMDQIEDRVGAVLAVIYLLFAEGYSATDGDGVRDELADEAIDLAQLATWLLPGHGEAHSLQALVLLQHARRPARMTPTGTLVALEDQDRARWDHLLIAACLESLHLARTASDTPDGVVGVYRPQAEIAALHCTPRTPKTTNSTVRTRRQRRWSAATTSSRHPTSPTRCAWPPCCQNPDPHTARGWRSGE